MVLANICKPTTKEYLISKQRQRQRQSQSQRQNQSNNEYFLLVIQNVL